MAENAMIRVACPNCGAQYDLDASFMGQTAECPCGAVFMIGTAPEDQEAAPAPAPEQQYQQSEYDAQQQYQQSAAAPQPPTQQAVTYPVDNAPTNTVKISRMSMVGMRPDIQDDFKVGTINASKQNVVTGTTSGKFGNKKFSSKKFSSSADTKKKASAKPKKKWWQFWK